MGIPYTKRALNEARSGGSPYGASHHVESAIQDDALSDDEKMLAQILGKRVVELSVRLHRKSGQV